MQKIGLVIINLTIMILVVLPLTTYAEDLGKRGATFTVKEEGFIEMVMRRLKEVDFAKENRKMQEIARVRIANPLPIEGVRPALQTREFYFDPTYVLKEDIVLPCGKILYKAGTRVNPLDHMSLERRLYFIDSRKDEQINWLKSELSIAKGNNNPVGEGEVNENRIILVGGSVLELEEELGEKVYIDQGGELTSRMGIKASPAIAEQEGKRLKVREVALNE